MPASVQLILWSTQWEGRWIGQEWKQINQWKGYSNNPGERQWQLRLGRQQWQWGEELRQLYLENEIHRTDLSGEWWNQGHSLTRSGSDLPLLPHFMPYSSLLPSLQHISLLSGLTSCLYPFLPPATGPLCLCCFLCWDCSSLSSCSFNSYSSCSQPPFSEKPSLASRNIEQVKFSSDPIHLTYIYLFACLFALLRVHVCVVFPSPCSLSSLETETMFIFP